MSKSGLLEKSLDLSGRKITVSEATYLMGLHRGELINREMERQKANGEVGLQANVRTGIYNSLVACSTGNLPSPEEFFRMRDRDIEEWIRVAKELNPHWFAWLDEAQEAVAKPTPEQKEEEKKSG